MLSAIEVFESQMSQRTEESQDTDRSCFSQVEQDGTENRSHEAALSRYATLLKEASLNLSCVSGFSLALVQLHSAVQHIKSLETEALK